MFSKLRRLLHFCISDAQYGNNIIKVHLWQEKYKNSFKTVDELYKGYFPEQTKEEKERLKNQPKEPIRLRVKKLSHSLSLYLDLYKDGKREYEFLKLYLNEETDLGVKEQNRLKFRDSIYYFA